MTASRSVPGQRSELLSARLGGRDRLIEIVSGPFHPVLKAFASTPRSSKSSDAFPAHDGIVLDGTRRYLSFDALIRLAPELDWTILRSFVDELSVARLMRQGLVLGCEECRALSFVSIDDLGQRFECVRCGAMNSLTHPRWNSQKSEPTFYYDLHETFRRLFEEHGDVSLLVAANLRKESHIYLDTAEVEFAREGERPSFEIDLIALADLDLVVVEAKSNGSLGKGRIRRDTITKRLEAARLLNADVVLFATTEPEWTTETQNAASAVRDETYPEIELRWIAGLSTTAD